MYAASISFGMLNEYLSELIDNNMLDYDPKKRQYKTTDKGNEFLTKYLKLKI